jgi:hypothetical protein
MSRAAATAGHRCYMPPACRVDVDGERRFGTSRRCSGLAESDSLTFRATVGRSVYGLINHYKVAHKSTKMA